MKHYLTIALAMALGASMPAAADSMKKQQPAMASSEASPNQFPIVGGAAMLPSRDIVENAMLSKDHTTLVAAIKAAGLVDTLKGAGPFTVFAPTNAAFAKLPAGTVDKLLIPANKPMLTSVLTYHVVPGNLDGKAIMKLIKKGKGRATLTTVQGQKLTVTLMAGTMIHLTDAKGNTAMVTQANVTQRNGVIHVIDTVLMPGM